MLLHGQIVATHGKQCVVELQDGRLLACIASGRKSELVCGDYVMIRQASADQGVIEAIDPRSHLFFRSNAQRKKYFAANITQLIFVLAPVPSFYEELLNRCLVAAESQDIRTIIVLNKSDLNESAELWQRLSLYRDLGYDILQISAKYNIDPLWPYLNNFASLLIGQSGMGKSTIVNRLIPSAVARTADISTALDSGRHTTTHARLYRIDSASTIIDSPGLQEFGLYHLTLNDLESGFIEFRPYLGQCRFNNCRHVNEPNCAIVGAVSRGQISEIRMAAYRKIISEVNTRI